MDSIEEEQYYCLLRVWEHSQQVFFALARDNKDSKTIDELWHLIRLQH